MKTCPGPVQAESMLQQFRGKNRRFAVFVLFAAVCAPTACSRHVTRAPSPDRGAEPTVISVVGTNDLHGHIERLPWFGGYVGNLRAARAPSGGVLLVDAGDMFQGTLASNLGEGEVVVQAYNQLGYAAVAVGNHEFDFGPEGPAASARNPEEDPRGALKARARQANFPFLAANVIQGPRGPALTAPNLQPSTIVTVAGVKVGLLGVTTEDTPRATLARNFAGLHLAPLAEAVKTQAAALRARGAVVIVVLAHAGAACRSFENPGDLSACTDDAEVFALARALPPGLVDAIVGGHTHAGVAHEVAGIPIIEAFSYGRAFGRVDLWVDPVTKKVVRHHLHPPRDICTQEGPACAPGRYEGRPVETDQRAASVTEPALLRVETIAARRLHTHLPAPVTRAYRTESALGNLLTDLMRKARPQADVAITNGGGLRQDLPAGELTYGQLYEALPFDNTFALARLRVDTLAEIVRKNLQTGRGFMSLSGLRVKAACDGGALVVRLLKDGRELPSHEMLTLATHDFLATGGDGLFGDLAFDIEAMPPVRDELAAVLSRETSVLAPHELYDETNPRVQYPGPRPVRCP